MAINKLNKSAPKLNVSTGPLAMDIADSSFSERSSQVNRGNYPLDVQAMAEISGQRAPWHGHPSCWRSCAWLCGKSVSVPLGLSSRSWSWILLFSPNSSRAVQWGPQDRTTCRRVWLSSSHSPAPGAIPALKSTITFGESTGGSVVAEMGLRHNNSRVCRRKFNFLLIVE